MIVNKNSEWDIFMNKDGFWCYRFQYRFKDYIEALGEEYTIIHTFSKEWTSVNPPDRVVIPV